MELEYTVISSPRPVSVRSRGPVVGLGADTGELIKGLAAEAQESWKVERIKGQPHEMADLNNDSRTISVTPAMPMSLIAPERASKASGNPVVSAGVAWGVEAVEADRSRFTGEGIRIAVLDTGIDSSHQAFKGLSLLTQNFTTDASGNDGNGHGTHCAGTIAGQSVNGTRIGIASELDRLIIGKVLTDKGSGSTTAIVQGIQWASLQGAHIISMSLGIDFTAYVESLHKEQDVDLKAAVSMGLQAYSANVEMFEKLGDSFNALSYIGQGALLVAAAGNESRRPTYTIATSPPAVADSILSVAAVDRGFGAARFSNTFADVSAPGVEISSAGLDGGLSVLSGTSMAAPHVAGVAALWSQKLLEAESQLNIDRLKSTLFANLSPAADRAMPDLENTGRGVIKSPLI
ncbi:MAG: S8 family serine peptidase [Granulosicoccus sp.]